MQLKDEQLDEIFNVIDVDGDGSIEKKEMKTFLKMLLKIQQNLSFKNAKFFDKYSSKF